MAAALRRQPKGKFTYTVPGNCNERKGGITYTVPRIPQPFTTLRIGVRFLIIILLSVGFLLSFLLSCPYADLIKYDSTGKILWSTGFRDDYNSISFSKIYSVYVVTYYDEIIRYDLNGNQVWVTSLDSATKIVSDATGNVYIAGRFESIPGGEMDIMITKVDRFGNNNWTKTFGGDIKGIDGPGDLVVDPNGNLFVTGGVTTLISDYRHIKDFITLEYDSGGELVHSALWSSSLYNNDIGKTICLDDSGNIFVSGIASSYNGQDIVTIKYFPDFAESWVAWFDNQDNIENVSDAAVDKMGNVYIAALSSTDNIYSDANIILLKYNPDGDEEWFDAYNYEGCESEGEPPYLTLDHENNVYLAGTSYSSWNNPDFVLLKYDGDGNRLWEARYDDSRDGPSGAPMADTVVGLVVDQEGNATVAGYTCPFYIVGSAGSQSHSQQFKTDCDYTIVSYDPEGNLRWAANYDDPPGTSATAHAVALDSEGNVYVTGSASLPVEDDDQADDDEDDDDDACGCGC